MAVESVMADRDQESKRFQGCGEEAEVRMGLVTVTKIPAYFDPTASQGYFDTIDE